MPHPGSTDEEREAGKSQGRARSHGGGWQNETVSRASVLRTPLFGDTPYTVMVKD